MLHNSINDDSCLLNISSMLHIDLSHDYAKLLKRDQWHTKCTESSFLWKKGSNIHCYSTPWELHSTSVLYIDEHGCKTYMHVDNDDTLNTHDHAIPSI